METIQLNNSIRNGIIGWIILGLFSFIYGGIYSEFVVRNMAFSFKNILLSIIGSIMIGFSAFTFLFSITLIYYYTTKNKIRGDI